MTRRAHHWVSSGWYRKIWDALSRFAKMRPSNRPKVAEENARRVIHLRRLYNKTTQSPSSTPKSRPGTRFSISSVETNAPMTPQVVTNRTRKRFTVESGVMFQGELRRFAGGGDGVALAAESR